MSILTISLLEVLAIKLHDSFDYTLIYANFFIWAIKICELHCVHIYLCIFSISTLSSFIS